MTIHLNLGSNLGSREDIIARAVALIKEALPGRVVCSRVMESEPWGYESDNTFMNMGVRVDTDLTYDPMDLLHIVQRVQGLIDGSPHRDATGAYIDRAIDIDVIAIDGTVMESGELTLPHPRMHLREFVLRPMAELQPGWVHPVTGKSVERMLEELSEG